MITIKNSIVKKIGFTIFLLVFIMFITYYNFLNIQIKTYLEQQSKDQLIKESEHLGAKIEMFLQKYIVIVDQAKNNQDFINLAKEVTDRYKKRENPLFLKTTNQLNDIHNLDKNISSAFIALERVNDIITNKYDYEIDSNYNLSLREWYNNTINENKTTITTPYVDLITNKTAITIAAPLKDNDEILGAIGLDILIENINLIMSEYKSKTNADIGLIYKTGQVLYKSDYNRTIEPTDIFIHELFDKNLVSQILSGGNSIEQYNYQEQEKYIAYFPVGNANLIVFTTILKSQALAQVNKFLVINLSILLGLLIVITVSLFFLRDIISKPLIKICSEMENYSDNISISLPVKYLDRKDEIGILSKGITLMLNNISSNIAKLEEKIKNCTMLKKL